MKVTFKLYAMLADHLPSQYEGRERDGNALELDVSEGTTVRQLVEQFRLPPRLVHLVLIDGRFIPKEERDARALVEGETLAIWPPVAGG
ncbi:MAG: MoaD/ThiS family protein [Burkholderiaceae bacterium]|nr:MoaD/ThiS family protein [Burkholderiaceae bacterium]